VENIIGGYLYIISNPKINGWYKIGITDNIKSRLSTYQTGDPHREYKVEYYIFHPKYKDAEKKIKMDILPFALDVKKEWIKIDLNMAKSRLDEVLMSYNNAEWK